jgi:hypothetical protein
VSNLDIGADNPEADGAGQGGDDDGSSTANKVDKTDVVDDGGDGWKLLERTIYKRLLGENAPLTSPYIPVYRATSVTPREPKSVGE